jgi:hypothetical protein
MNISIGKYLPHRPPMLMVDTITAIDDTSVVTEFFIKENSIFLEKGHLTEAGLIENMAQTCSAIVGQFFFGINDVSKNVIGYISAIKRADIYELPLASQAISTRAKLLSRFDDEQYSLCAMEASVYYQNSLLAEAQMNLFIKEIIQ